MRIELGGAFADLLNEKGKGSGENEMGYVQRTLGFRTRELNNQDLRLVIHFNPFSVLHDTNFCFISNNLNILCFALWSLTVKIKLRTRCPL